MGKLGTAIRQRRKDLKIKVYELAQKTGVHPTYITYIEKHDRVPSLEIINKLEKHLKISLVGEYLLEKHPTISPVQRAHFVNNLNNEHSLSNKRPPHSPPILPPMVIKEFPTPEAQRLAQFILRNAESLTMILNKSHYETLLKAVAPDKVGDSNLFKQVLDIMREMKKEKEEYWQKFLKQSKKIESLIIDPKHPKTLFKPASKTNLANRELVKGTGVDHLEPPEPKQS